MKRYDEKMKRYCKGGEILQTTESTWDGYPREYYTDAFNSQIVAVSVSLPLGCPHTNINISKVSSVMMK